MKAINIIMAVLTAAIMTACGSGTQEASSPTSGTTGGFGNISSTTTAPDGRKAVENGSSTQTYNGFSVKFQKPVLNNADWTQFNRVRSKFCSNHADLVFTGGTIIDNNENSTLNTVISIDPNNNACFNVEWDNPGKQKWPDLILDYAPRTFQNVEVYPVVFYVNIQEVGKLVNGQEVWKDTTQDLMQYLFGPDLMYLLPNSN